MSAAVRHAPDALWLAIALLFNLIFAARALAPALEPQVVQDDVRQHVFWMARFRDPSLFPNDLITEYYEAIAPPGFVALYRLLNLAFDLVTATKLIPVVLGLVTTTFTYRLTRQLHPSPTAAFLASLLFGWFLWQGDDLVSATPRAFVAPLLAGVAWALATRRHWVGAGLVVLAALLYPIGGLIGLAIFGACLVCWSGWRPVLSTSRGHWAAFGLALVLSLGLAYQNQQATARFGPTVTGEQARGMPELGPTGRSYFFYPDPYRFWFVRERSGLDLRAQDRQLFRIPVLYELAILAGLLPLLLIFRGRLAAVRRLSGPIGLLPTLVVVSFGLFFLAHALLFRLYIPNRYVKWSLPLALVVAAGLALAILFDTLAGRVPARFRTFAAEGPALLFALWIVLNPTSFESHWVRDPHPFVSAYLRTLPKETLVAAIPLQADYVPLFTQRKVLASIEHSIPYQLGYYSEIRRRLSDLVAGYYASNPAEVLSFARRYGIDVILVDRAAFIPTPYATGWGTPPAFKTEPFTSAVLARLGANQHFALLEALPRCAQADDGVVAAVPVACLAEQP